MLLALDTATRQSGLALFDGHQLVVELNWVSNDNQTSELAPRLAQALDWCALQPASLSGIAVSLGPGSYTGLRVALSVAKGLALAHAIPLLGIPTLDATAYPHLGRSQPVCASLQAGRGQVCWAIYRPLSSAGMASALPDSQRAVLGGTAYRLGSWEDLAASLHEPTLCVGELPAAARQQLLALAGERALLASPAIASRRAGSLAELGWARLQAGEADDLASLSPIYLREP